MFCIFEKKTAKYVEKEGSNMSKKNFCISPKRRLKYVEKEGSNMSKM